MTSKFSVTEYMKILGDELISAFAQGGLAPTPGIKGEARETAVRAKLRQLLPLGIGVGSGFVIDSDGNTSRQPDIVLYEEDICPVFRLNESHEGSFYPCEGVFAVGEIKSTIGSKETQDIIEKIASVRKLNRFAFPKTTEQLPNNFNQLFTRGSGQIHGQAHGPTSLLRRPIRNAHSDLNQSGKKHNWQQGNAGHIEKIASVRKLNRFAFPKTNICFRPYGSRLALGLAGKSYDQNSKGEHQIWGFGIARDTAITPPTLAQKIADYCERENRILAPNLITTTEGLVVKPITVHGQIRQVAWSAIEATGYMTTVLPNPLASLIRDLNRAFKGGFTVPEEAYYEYAPIPETFAPSTYHPMRDSLALGPNNP